MELETILSEFGRLCSLSADQAQQYRSLAQAAVAAVASQLKAGAQCEENSGRLALAAAYWMRERYLSQSGGESALRLGELSVTKKGAGSAPDEWRLLIADLLLPQGVEFFSI